MLLPGSSTTGAGVELQEQLAHGSDEGDFAGLTALARAWVEAAAGVVMAHGREGRQVQSAAAGAIAAVLAALAGELTQLGQAGGAFTDTAQAAREEDAGFAGQGCVAPPLCTPGPVVQFPYSAKGCGVWWNAARWERALCLGGSIHARVAGAAAAHRAEVRGLVTAPAFLPG